MLYMIEDRENETMKIVDVNIHLFREKFCLLEAEYHCLIMSYRFGGKPVTCGHFTAYKYE